MVIPDAAMQRKTQVRDLAAQAPESQFGKLLRILLALHDGLDHRPPRNPENVAGDGSQLDVGVFEGLVDTVNDRRSIPHELRTMAGEIAQLTDRRGRHEATPQQPVLKELSDPLPI